MQQRLADRLAATPAWPVAALAVYLALMAAMAALLAPSGRSDDLETLLLSQSLEWGYHSKNPPAFFWLAHGATALFGPHVAVIYALRLTGVWLMFVGLYAIARRVQPDPLLAVGAGFAMLATLHFHWYLLFYLTNTAFAIALAPAAVLALLRVKARGTVGAWALFGLVVGLGLLCRYNFAVFAAALAAAALVAPEWRARVLVPRALVGVGVAALVIAPHLVWVLGHLETLAAQVGDQLVGEPSPYGSRVAEGMGNLAEAAVSILALPLGLMALVCFPTAFRPVRVADPERASVLGLLRRTVVFSLGLMAVYVLAGSAYVKPHHLFFLIFAPLWLIGRLDRAALRPWAAPTFAAGLAALCVVAAVAFPLSLHRDAADCGACEEFQPIERYAEALRAAGFEHGTILALARRQDFPTAALLGQFPEARLVAFDYPLYAPPPNAVPGDCLMVWDGAREWPEGWPGSAPAGATIGTVTGRVNLSDRPSPGMRYVLVKGGSGDCR